MATPAKKQTAKNPVSRKRRVKEKTTIAATAAIIEAPAASQVEVGDIVMFMSSDGSGQVGPGRVCTLLNFDEACVMFGDSIGCRRVFTNRLSPAPGGSTAPACVGCDDC